VTFIITILSVDAREAYEGRSPPLLVEPVVVDGLEDARAGNISALRRFPNVPTGGLAYHMLLDEDGYQSSNAFFEYAKDPDEAAFLAIPRRLRAQFANVLRDLIELSPTRRAVLILEDNGHVTDPELTAEEIRTIERLGPISLTEFWHAADRHVIREDSVVVIGTW